MSRQVSKKNKCRFYIKEGIDESYFTVLEFQASALQNWKKKTSFVLAHKANPKLPTTMTNDA